jgi:uncharacterized RDD family membrane protein YckC
MAIEIEPLTGLSGLLRRLASMAYDLLVVGALLMMAALPVVLLAGDHLRVAPGRALFQAYLLLVTFLFFGGFWVHGGQTPGMRAWRLRLIGAAGAGVSWRQAAGRFCAALLSWLAGGLGYLWALRDPQGRAWHDRLSATRLVLISRE